MDEDLRYKTGGGIRSNIDLMHEAYLRAEGIKDEKSKDGFLNSLSETFAVERMKDKFHSIIMPTIGLVLFCGMVAIAFFNPFPSAYQRSTYAIGIAFFGGLGAALIPGYFEFRFRGLVRAGGALGVFAFIYLSAPKTYSNVQDSFAQKITLELVPKDTTALQSIPADFNPNMSDKLCHFVATAVSKYTGDPVSDTDYVCYRISDGLIYSQEKCQDLRESTILMIAHNVASSFSSKRAAYIHFVKRFKN
jgi:hypothetical protein